MIGEIPEFKVGSRVKHEAFGDVEGTVLRCFPPNRYGWYQVEVEWDKAPGHIKGTSPYAGPESIYCHSVACLKSSVWRNPYLGTTR